MESFCRELPKIELHAHLNGSLSPTTLKKLGCLDESFSQYQKAETDIKEVFKQFQVAHKATNTKENLYIATKSVIEEFAEDNVIYLELRSTPRREELMSEEEYIETVLTAIMEKSDPSKIIVKLLLSLDRRMTYENQAKFLDIIIKYKKLYPDVIRGIDLSGDPAKGSFYSELFEKARNNGLLTAIHCAEIKNDEEVKSILNFKPDRIGHGTVLHPNYNGCPENWKMYKKLNIPVECCLTSNIICLTSKSYKDHHVQEWIRGSLPFCLATDDSGVMNTSLSKEFWHVQESFNLNTLDLWTISKNSIDYSFATPEEKGILRTKLEQWKKENIIEK